jgi:hypothetical protein
MTKKNKKYEPVFRITPKGLISVLSHHDETAWEDLEKFVRDRSECKKDEYPALVFRAGGICIGIPKKMLVKSDD